MNGQWTGTFSGTNNGALVIEVDDVGGGYEGSVIAADQNSAHPSVLGEFLAPKGQREFTIRVLLSAVERTTGRPILDEELRQRFPNSTPAKYADTHWNVEDGQIKVHWSTDVGTEGEGEARIAAGSKQSELTATVMNWDEFKTYATGLEPARYIFRGQESNQWKLRTAFHRTGRANLRRFMRQDVAALYRHLTGLTSHRFDLENPHDYAAFLALVQHHGYPTPLLDWTLSPFIAAYFAFRNPTLGTRLESTSVRINVFSALDWNRIFERAVALAPAFRYLTILEPLALNNPRVLPQQGLSLVTNIDDLEKYIIDQGTNQKVQFLSAIDITTSERPKVLKELALMGINAGSLFPGLDGACNQLKERFFDL
jgi:hypothetical protein